MSDEDQTILPELISVRFVRFVPCYMLMEEFRQGELGLFLLGGMNGKGIRKGLLFF